MREQISLLQNEMKQRGISAYIVLTEDFHGSEYVGEHFKLREYLSGFTGSAGTLVVTEEKAALWTDGRYFIQAAAELENSGITLMKMGEPKTPKIARFLQEELCENSVLGFDGRTVNADFALRLEKKLKQKNITFKTDEDLGGSVWKDRPALSRKSVFALSDEVCGATRAEKLAKIREKMSKKDAACLALSALDEIAWTLNLRGGDVEYNPVFLAFMLIFEDKVSLFAERSVFGDDIAADLKKDNIDILPYSEIYSALSELQGKVWADPKAVNYRFWRSLDNAEIISRESPIAMMKAVKSAAEIDAVKSAHLKDGIAVTRFMYWLKHMENIEEITEISAAEKLEEFRKTGEGYLGQSFEPIIGFGEHGAIVHYSATEDTNCGFSRGLLLTDTGGHYMDGTTDITRTFVLKSADETEKRMFTYVLAAHLDLLCAVFPKGVCGSTLDGITRRGLWQRGLDFNHGTGHGVGFLLNVHEGPQRISWHSTNDVPIVPGMVTSDEPGLYFEGKFGIRHESMILCVKRDDLSSDDLDFYGFEPLTLVPFDRDGISFELLTDEQKRALCDYHELVYKALSPHLPQNEADWLREVTAPF